MCQECLQSNTFFCANHSNHVMFYYSFGPLLPEHGRIFTPTYKRRWISCFGVLQWVLIQCICHCHRPQHRAQRYFFQFDRSTDVPNKVKLFFNFLLFTSTSPTVMLINLTNASFWHSISTCHSITLNLSIYIAISALTHAPVFQTTYRSFSMQMSLFIGRLWCSIYHSHISFALSSQSL